MIGQTSKETNSPPGMPHTWGTIVIKANLGKEDSPTDEETTANEDGESELTKLLSMPKVQKAKKKAPTRRQQGVPKNAIMVVFTKLRLKPCNQCKVPG